MPSEPASAKPLRAALSVCEDDTLMAGKAKALSWPRRASGRRSRAWRWACGTPRSGLPTAISTLVLLTGRSTALPRPIAPGRPGVWRAASRARLVPRDAPATAYGRRHAPVHARPPGSLRRGRRPRRRGAVVDLGHATEVGRLLAEQGAVVLTGGHHGVMRAAAAGATGAGGVAIGLLPGLEREAGRPEHTYLLPTGLGELRNGLLVRSADAVVAVGCSWGTLERDRPRPPHRRSARPRRPVAAARGRRHRRRGRRRRGPGHDRGPGTTGPD